MIAGPLFYANPRCNLAANVVGRNTMGRALDASPSVKLSLGPGAIVLPPQELPGNIWIMTRTPQ